MTRTVNPAHMLALIAALFITTATFSHALSVPAQADTITTAALA